MANARLLSSMWREYDGANPYRQGPPELYLIEAWKVGRGYIVEIQNVAGDRVTGPLCVPASWPRRVRTPGWRETCDFVAKSAASLLAFWAAREAGVLSDNGNDDED